MSENVVDEANGDFRNTCGPTGDGIDSKVANRHPESTSDAGSAIGRGQLQPVTRVEPDCVQTTQVASSQPTSNGIHLSVDASTNCATLQLIDEPEPRWVANCQKMPLSDSTMESADSFEIRDNTPTDDISGISRAITANYMTRPPGLSCAASPPDSTITSDDQLQHLFAIVGKPTRNVAALSQHTLKFIRHCQPFVVRHYAHDIPVGQGWSCYLPVFPCVLHTGNACISQLLACATAQTAHEALYCPT
jgi:hypothetical protein